MDDWIRDRVKVENNAIKAAMTQLQSGPPWEEEAFDDGSHSPVSPGKPRRKRSQSSPGGGQGRRRRREVLKALEPCTLDVDVFQPPSADDGEHGGELFVGPGLGPHLLSVARHQGSLMYLWGSAGGSAPGGSNGAGIFRSCAAK